MLFAAIGMGLAWSGLINIGASSGHWAVTDWFLHWAMRNTVRTQAALTVKEPASDPAGLVSAASHYAANCATCHGAPGMPLPPVMQAATPPPPELARTAGSWSNRQLFWIIKHGVKFTAMPAWPAQDRDDEIRRMVAFVRRLPDLDPTEYRRLAGDAAATVSTVAAGAPAHLRPALSDCERCHADHGRGQPDIPVLAGQKPEYLAATLAAYVSGERKSAVMAAAASRAGLEVRQALADHYAALPGGLTEPELGDAADEVQRSDRFDGSDAADAAAAAAARQVVAQGLPERDLPACSKCHSAGKRSNYPILGGQKPDYLANRLRLWRGDPKVVEARKPNESMPTIARRIPAHLIEPLARHYGRRETTANR